MMMIFPLSVVLLGTLDYTHAAESEPQNQIADTCSRKLGDYISERCSNLKTKLLTFSGCSYTCQGKNRQGQNATFNHFLMNGLPCGECKECCNGVCTAVKFGLGNPLTLESCAKQQDSS
uniref:Putative ixostatin n=1 Tax=Ixodes ricinus TaxID=34613 RepID=A0A0K8RIH2_IXORI